MEYLNGTFTLQNNEATKISAFGADANTLYGVIINMMNTNIELTPAQIQNAYYSMGGRALDEAFMLLENGGFINRDTKEIFVLQSNDKPLAYNYKVGHYVYHFNLFSKESKTAFEALEQPELQKLKEELIQPAEEMAAAAPIEKPKRRPHFSCDIQGNFVPPHLSAPARTLFKYYADNGTHASLVDCDIMAATKLTLQELSDAAAELIKEHYLTYYFDEFMRKDWFFTDYKYMEDK